MLKTNAATFFRAMVTLHGVSLSIGLGQATLQFPLQARSRTEVQSNQYEPHQTRYGVSVYFSGFESFK